MEDVTTSEEALDELADETTTLDDIVLLVTYDEDELGVGVGEDPGSLLDDEVANTIAASGPRLGVDDRVEDIVEELTTSLGGAELLTDEVGSADAEELASEELVEGAISNETDELATEELAEEVTAELELDD